MGALVSLDQVEFAQAYSNVATGAMGAAVATDRGSSHADASHFDTWNCANAVACAALEAAGSFVPVTLHLHVSGSASLTPGGGFMELTYSYDTSSLLGSNALGRFDFDFFEDPGFGLNADVEGKATFEDYHTGAQHDIFVDIASGGPANSGIIAFTADATVNTFIGGCVTMSCDLTNGIFTDTQSLSAIIDHANDNSAQILSSLNTFSDELCFGLALRERGRQNGSGSGCCAGAGVDRAGGRGAAWLGRTAASGQLDFLALKETPFLAPSRVRVPVIWSPSTVNCHEKDTVSFLPACTVVKVRRLPSSLAFWMLSGRDFFLPGTTTEPVTWPLSCDFSDRVKDMGGAAAAFFPRAVSSAFHWPSIPAADAARTHVKNASASFIATGMNPRRRKK
jgi:hypothetical protein